MIGKRVVPRWGSPFLLPVTLTTGTCTWWCLIIIELEEVQRKVEFNNGSI